ncbi:hypothetical protein, partial [Tranquillimonas alkanivorans]|uniref:hypothetical protein n=1 Tax=Tranquillimonas alkanivorans TaxID=441119 RepID=UPI001C4325D0
IIAELIASVVSDAVRSGCCSDTAGDPPLSEAECPEWVACAAASFCATAGDTAPRKTIRAVVPKRYVDAMEVCLEDEILRITDRI